MQKNLKFSAENCTQSWAEAWKYETGWHPNQKSWLRRLYASGWID